MQGADRVGLRPCDARGGRQRGSARCQMQKISAGKFHFEPPFASFDHFVGAGEQRKRYGDAERPCTLATRALASWRPARRQMDRPPFTHPLTILPRIVLMSACVNARSVCVRTFPRAPLLNPSAVMEISSGASTIATTSYSPNVQNTSFTVAPHFVAMSLKASARFGVSLIFRIP